MEFKGTLIVVKDCKKALKFYQDMFGFELIRDHDGNMELSGNLYLQEEKYWERFTGRRGHGICESPYDAQLGTAGRQIL